MYLNGLIKSYGEWQQSAGRNYLVESLLVITIPYIDVTITTTCCKCAIAAYNTKNAPQITKRATSQHQPCRKQIKYDSIQDAYVSPVNIGNSHWMKSNSIDRINCISPSFGFPMTLESIPAKEAILIFQIWQWKLTTKNNHGQSILLTPWKKKSRI